MRKIFVIAAREYKAAVRTKSFLISVLMLPLMMGGSVLVQLLLKDQVDVLVGDQGQVAAPVWVGAASGITGMVALQLTIADPIPPA